MSQLQVTGEAKIRDIQGPVVANSGVVTALDGAASQYVRGDGTLADFPTSTGGGSSVSYYLNSSVSQGTIGGVAYRELNREPVIGAGTDITISANGYVASYITDANDPDLLSVPGGNFNCEFYFSVDSNAHNPSFYAELYKYDGATFTLLGTSAAVPEFITQGTTIAPYYFAIPVATAALALTDRLAIRIYVNVDGRTVTLHTENGHLCQVVTTFSKGMISLNNLTDQSQYLATGTSGTDFGIVSSGDTHTFNLPVASAANTGKLSSTDWSTFNGKVPYTGATQSVNLGGFGLIASALNITNTSTLDGNILLKKAGIAVTTPTYVTQFAATTGVGIGYSDGTGGANFVLQTAAIYDYTFPAITGTLALLEGFQTFTGVKTFDEGLSLKSGAYPTPATGYSSIGGNPFGITVITKQSSTIYTSDFGFPTANRTFIFPNADGTIALTSDLGGYVTLATAQTISGAKTFSSSPIIDNGTSGIPLRFKQYASTNFGLAGYTDIIPIGANILAFAFGQTGADTKIAYFSAASLTNNVPQEYTLPNATGTIALTSNLSAYLPLTGGTLTGALSGTSATFSGEVTSSGSQGRFGGWATGAGYQGNALEAGVSGGTATLLGFNRTSGAYIPLLIGGNTNQTTTIGGNTIVLQNNGVTALTIASTGFATFSSSIAATNATFKVNADRNLAIKYDTHITLSGQSDSGAPESLRVYADTFRLFTATTAAGLTERLTVTNGGNVGIGTSSPVAADSSSVTLQLRNTVILQNVVGFQALFSNNAYYDGAGWKRAYATGAVGAMRINADSGQNGISFHVATTGAAGSSISNWDGTDIKMRINLDGNVGIGTSNPANILTVQANDTFNQDSSGQIVIRGASNTAKRLGIGFDTTNNYAYLQAIEAGVATRPLVLQPFGGNVLIGTTSNASNYKFVVSSNAYVPQYLAMGVNDDGRYIGQGNIISGAFQSYDLTIVNYATSGRVTITNGSNGVVLNNGATSWSTFSDERLKNINGGIENAVDKLLSIRAVKYSWKTDKTNKENLGLIAQDIEKVFPQVIDESKSFNEGDDTEYLSVKYTELIPVLVKAIQEQQAQIEELKTLINK